MKINIKSINLSITKDETFIIKAIGILLIMLHNYFRWVNPSLGESEFSYHPDALNLAINYSKNGGWAFIKAFFNYFGHYGVQIFIFLSGYGLVQSYQKDQTPWIKFVIKRFQKLYPSLVVAIIVYYLYVILIRRFYPPADIITDIFAHLSLTATLIPGKGLAINGPWWFYSTIFQLYLLFPLLVLLYKRYKTLGFLIIGVLTMLLTHYFDFYKTFYPINLMGNFVGQLPVFLVGIWFGFNTQFKIKPYLFVLLSAIFIAGCYYSFIWPLTHLCISVLLIGIGKSFSKLISHVPVILKIFIFIGTISVYLFAFNGFMRWPLADIANNNLHIPWFATFVSIMFLLTCVLFAYLFTNLEAFWRDKILTYRNLSLKIVLTLVIIGIPILIIVWLYKDHKSIQAKEPITKITQIEEVCDSTKNDIEYLTTDFGTKVKRLNQNIQYTEPAKFHLSEFDLSNSNYMVMRANLLCDSIPKDFWIITESFFGKIMLSWDFNNLRFSKDDLNHWMPIEFRIEQNKYLLKNMREYRYLFYARTNGTVYLDNIRVDIE